MKSFCLILTLFITQCIYSQSGCPVAYKRDLAGGLCTGAQGQIRLYFNSCPAFAPKLDSIYSFSTKLNYTYSLPNTSECAQKGNVTYCIYGGALPASPGLKIYLSYPNSKVICYLPEAGALPIVMGSFTARRTGSAILLNWEVQHEIHSSVFEIERAYGNAAFQTIGILPNHPNSANRQYTYSDNTNTTSGITYYRINMVDRNGSYTYSDIRAVKGLNAVSGLVVYPNPSTGTAKISITDMAEPTTVKILDASARLVKSIELTSTNTAEVNGLSKGNYIVRSTGKISGISTISKLTVIN